ncbi:hypothetical protein BDN72DRAFT_857092 [Pluteus cervinus]|uniref:Uncharacterized protein n=1 Tax=Pluteus cervinus TaxID=181527 RepID=A0ACD3AXC9_9AGAR|nr:hypothetical protein BDN72DRAFT_857092 [Pluteus cervinus]
MASLVVENSPVPTDPAGQTEVIPKERLRPLRNASGIVALWGVVGCVFAAVALFGPTKETKIDLESCALACLWAMMGPISVFLWLLALFTPQSTVYKILMSRLYAWATAFYNFFPFFIASVSLYESMFVGVELDPVSTMVYVLSVCPFIASCNCIAVHNRFLKGLSPLERSEFASLKDLEKGI